MPNTIYHRHRIIPGHQGGTYAPENVVLLTVEEHAEAHRKLYEEHGRWQDKLAWRLLSGQIGREEANLAILREAAKNRVYTDEWRENLSKAAIKREAKKKEEGYVVPQSSRDKQSKARKGNQYNKGKKWNDEQRKAHSERLKGREVSDSHREALSIANKDNPNCSGHQCNSVIKSRKENPLYHDPYVHKMIDLDKQGLKSKAIFEVMKTMYPEINIKSHISIRSALKSIQRIGI